MNEGGTIVRGMAAKASFGLRGLATAAAMAVAVTGATAQSPAPQSPATQTPSPQTGPVSGLPIPRYVSLKSDEVNLRTGPGRDYPTQWVFRRAGLPVEVLEEFEGWRKVRDAEGVTGWVSQTLLSGRRTGLVMPWEVKPDVPPPKLELKDDDSERARPTALIEAGVIANLQSCDSRWCFVTVETFRGYVEQGKLWGIYPGEIIK